MALRKILPLVDRETPDGQMLLAALIRDSMIDDAGQGFASPIARPGETLADFIDETPLSQIEALTKEVTEASGRKSGASSRSIDQLLKTLELEDPDPAKRQAYKRLRQKSELIEGKAKRLRDKLFAEYKSMEAKAISAAASGSQDPAELRKIFQFRNAQQAEGEMRQIFLDELSKSGVEPARARQIADELAEEYRETFSRREMASAFEEGRVGARPDAPRRSPTTRAADKRFTTDFTGDQGLSRVPLATADSADNITDLDRTERYISDKYTPSEFADLPESKRPKGPRAPLLFGGGDPTKEEARFTRVTRAGNLEIDVNPNKGAPYTLVAKQSRTNPGMVEVTRVVRKGNPDRSAGFLKDQVQGVKGKSGLKKLLGLTDEQAERIAYAKNKPGRPGIMIPIDEFYGGLKKGTLKGTPAAAFFARFAGAGKGGGSVRNFLGDEVDLSDPKVRERLRKSAEGIKKFNALPAAERARLLSDKPTSLKQAIEEARKAAAKRAGFSRPQSTLTGNSPLERNLRIMEENLAMAEKAKAAGARVGKGVKLKKRLYERRPGRKFRGNPILSLLMMAAQSAGGLRGGL